jgi:hypothetical protein
MLRTGWPISSSRECAGGAAKALATMDCVSLRSATAVCDGVVPVLGNQSPDMKNSLSTSVALTVLLSSCSLAFAGELTCQPCPAPTADYAAM